MHDGRDSYILKREEAKDMLLHVVCAWCSTYLGAKDAGRQSVQELISISHGICPDCAKKEAKKYKLNVEKPVRKRRSRKQADTALAA